MWKYWTRRIEMNVIQLKVSIKGPVSMMTPGLQINSAELQSAALITIALQKEE